MQNLFACSKLHPKMWRSLNKPVEFLTSSVIGSVRSYCHLCWQFLTPFYHIIHRNAVLTFSLKSQQIADAAGTGVLLFWRIITLAVFGPQFKSSFLQHICSCDCIPPDSCMVHCSYTWSNWILTSVDLTTESFSSYIVCSFMAENENRHIMILW